MKIRCAICNLGFESLVIDKEMALKDLSNVHAKHLNSKHPEAIHEMRADVAKLIPVLPWYLQFTKYIDYDLSEDFIHEHYANIVVLVTSTLEIMPATDADSLMEPLPPDDEELALIDREDLLDVQSDEAE